VGRLKKKNEERKTANKKENKMQKKFNFLFSTFCCGLWGAYGFSGNR